MGDLLRPFRRRTARLTRPPLRIYEPGRARGRSDRGDAGNVMWLSTRVGIGSASGSPRCQNERVSEDKGTRRQLPPWLLGLILAAVIFGLVFLVLQALGFGDEPAIESAVSDLLTTL